MSDGRVVITGGNRGIGLALAQMLARSRRRVTIACRGTDEGRRAIDALGLAEKIDVASLDLSSFASIDRFVRASPDDIAAIVNNAGAMFAERRLTDDGIERSLAVNCVGPMRLTEALLEKAAKTLRVVNVVTAALGKVELGAPAKKHTAMSAYLDAKMAFMHVARAWASAWKARAVVHNVHPGMVRTAMFEAPRAEGGVFWRVMIPMLRPFVDPPERAARTLAKLVDDPAYEPSTTRRAAAPADWSQRADLWRRLQRRRLEQPRSSSPERRRHDVVHDHRARRSLPRGLHARAHRIPSFDSR
jgi:retinol dehydrogenase-12